MDHINAFTLLHSKLGTLTILDTLAKLDILDTMGNSVTLKNLLGHITKLWQFWKLRKVGQIDQIEKFGHMGKLWHMKNLEI